MLFPPRTQQAVISFVSCIILVFTFFSCSTEQDSTPKENHFSQADYTKTETYVEMRDGIKLWTTIYSPKDTTQDYPVLLKRTPYSCAPYGKDTMPANIMHNPDLIASGYHFIIQDVRGRWMSEGKYENVKPPYSFENPERTDEVTDSWDTFEWLQNNLKNYNGNAGMYGNSYPGWTTLVGARSNHPSLKAVIAMAPVTNFYFEDFNRYGLFALNYVPVINFFGTQHNGPTSETWWPERDTLWNDEENDVSEPYYEFFLERMALTNFDDILDSTNFFWKNIRSHSAYDEFHQKRDWIQHLDSINCHVMIAGGFNDEQNLYGNLNSYKKIAQHSDKAQLLLGPWSHGHNKRRDSLYYLGNIFLGADLGKNYQENEEFEYFEYHLKGRGTPPDFKVKLYDNGTLSWHEFDKFPATPNQEKVLFLDENGNLNDNTPENQKAREFVADPFHPVPYLEENDFHRMAPKKYFTDDQRFLNEREDVLSWTSEPLEEDLTVLGEIKALIEFATDHEDADLYVKVIDVYPEDRADEETDLEGINYKGYQRLVRLGYIRGRYRESFEAGKPFVSGEKTSVQVPLLDVFHTFKKGHRIMVQIQSSMFPLFDLNPQKYVEDIYQAEKGDFEKAKHSIYQDSKIILPIMEL
ncbi:MAG: CocE/NonD family hydrolase [Flavobacteriales bacterium]|nr:CocE/NonD family hydrolase [Flavobacteriales bacterium]